MPKEPKRSEPEIKGKRPSASIFISFSLMDDYHQDRVLDAVRPQNLELDSPHSIAVRN